ncbi:MAG TPA: 2-phospho-L-lactate guanylyltransferase [Acidimicrobiales bacterium]|jgi:2-phospho-L-lactate guanylyltransferase
MPGTHVLVPIKSFRNAKVRLAGALPPSERAALARRMADRVLAAAGPLPVSVVCDDIDVASFAEARGAEVIWRPGLGLNAAVSDGVTQLTDESRAVEVIVAHADLPLADDLARLAGFAGVTFVPDRRDDGTNVVCVPTRLGFTFSYGPGSFERHRAEADRLRLPYRVLRDPRLGWDVDVPADLEFPQSIEPCS